MLPWLLYAFQINACIMCANIVKVKKPTILKQKVSALGEGDWQLSISLFGWLPELGGDKSNNLLSLFQEPEAPPPRAGAPWPQPHCQMVRTLSPSHTQPGPWRFSPGCGSLLWLPEILRDGRVPSILIPQPAPTRKIPFHHCHPPLLFLLPLGLSGTMLMPISWVSYWVPSTQQSHHVEYFTESTARSVPPWEMWAGTLILGFPGGSVMKSAC